MAETIDLPEARRRFQVMIQSLPEIVLQSLEAAADDGLQMIIERTREKGLDFNETPFKPYTEPYKKYKTKKGQYVGYVNLRLSNTHTMFAGTGRVEEKVENGIAKVVVKGRDTFTQQKLDGNAKTRGDILGLAKQEIQDLHDDFETRIFKKVDEILGK